MDTNAKTPIVGGSPWLIGAKQAAELMSIHPRTVLNLVHVEGFPSVRVGRRWLIDPVKLRKWIDDNMGGGVEIER